MQSEEKVYTDDLATLITDINTLAATADDPRTISFVAPATVDIELQSLQARLGSILSNIFTATKTAEFKLTTWESILKEIERVTELSQSPGIVARLIDSRKISAEILLLQQALTDALPVQLKLDTSLTSKDPNILYSVMRSLPCKTTELIISADCKLTDATTNFLKALLTNPNCPIKKVIIESSVPGFNQLMVEILQDKDNHVEELQTHLFNIELIGVSTYPHCKLRKLSFTDSSFRVVYELGGLLRDTRCPLEELALDCTLVDEDTIFEAFADPNHKLRSLSLRSMTPVQLQRLVTLLQQNPTAKDKSLSLKLLMSYGSGSQLAKAVPTLLQHLECLALPRVDDKSTRHELMVTLADSKQESRLQKLTLHQELSGDELLQVLAMLYKLRCQLTDLTLTIDWADLLLRDMNDLIQMIVYPDSALTRFESTTTFSSDESSRALDDHIQSVFYILRLLNLNKQLQVIAAKKEITPKELSKDVRYPIRVMQIAFAAAMRCNHADLDHLANLLIWPIHRPLMRSSDGTFKWVEAYALACQFYEDNFRLSSKLAAIYKKSPSLSLLMAADLLGVLTDDYYQGQAKVARSKKHQSAARELILDYFSNLTNEQIQVQILNTNAPLTLEQCKQIIGACSLHDAIIAVKKAQQLKELLETESRDLMQQPIAEAEQRNRLIQITKVLFNHCYPDHNAEERWEQLQVYHAHIVAGLTKEQILTLPSNYAIWIAAQHTASDAFVANSWIKAETGKETTTTYKQLHSTLHWDPNREPAAILEEDDDKEEEKREKSVKKESHRDEDQRLLLPSKIEEYDPIVPFAIPF